MIDKIDSVVNAIGGFLYQPYIVPLFLIVAGLYFTIRTGLIQFRLFGESIHVVAEKPKEKGSISSFGALMVSTASRVGTGNIVGVSTAICLGGFGAVFWMWVVALLGGAPGGEREIYSLPELVEAFDIKGISKSPAIFDIDKLKYFNSAYIRAMTPEQFAAVAAPYIRQTVKNPTIDPAQIAPLLQQRCEVLTDIPEKVDFFDALPEYDITLYTNKKSKTDPAVSLEMLKTVRPLLAELPAWDDETLLAAMKDLAERLEVKNAKVMWPVRIAVSGRAVTPGGAVEICRILGRDETLRRLKAGLAKLG